MTIMEEGTELLTRLKQALVDKNPDVALPMTTSCSPGWVKFIAHTFPEYLPNVSSCKSPQQMFGALAKTYYAQNRNLDPKDIVSVSIMPCTAKKYEASREEHQMDNGTPYTDAVLTTRECIWMIKCMGVDFANLPDGSFDSPLGESSGAADIFGATGGVMEAALRTAYEKVTGESCPKLEFDQVRGVKGIKEATIDINGTMINIAVSNGLNNAKALFDRVATGDKQYHLIEVMACPGGCVGGGGQPYPPDNVVVLDPQLVEKRARALYGIDSNKKLRTSHTNPSIIKLYEEFLGEPNGEKSHRLMHTTYKPVTPKGIR